MPGYECKCAAPTAEERTSFRGRLERRRFQEVDFNRELDARGLSCPLPILKTKKALNELSSGQVLKIVATDPGSVKDMQAFSNQTGHPLLASIEENKAFVFYLRKR